MLSSWKKQQQNRRIFSQLDYSEQDVIIGYAVSGQRKNVEAISHPADHEFSKNYTVVNVLSDENKVDIRALEKYLTGRIDKKMKIIVGAI